MKFALVFAAVLAVSATETSADIISSLSLSNPVSSNDQNARLLRYDNEANPDGSYRYNLQISNGITAQAQGTPRDFGGNPPVAPVVSQGSFSWTTPESQFIDITYVADENGYRSSSHIHRIRYEGFLPPASDVGRTITFVLKNSQNRRA